MAVATLDQTDTSQQTPAPAAAPPAAPPPAVPSPQPAFTPTVASAPPAQPDIVDKVNTLSDSQRKYFFSQMTDDQRTRFQAVLQQKITARQTQPPPAQPSQPGLIQRFQTAADKLVNAPITDSSGKPLNGTGFDTGIAGQGERFGQGVLQGGESLLIHPEKSIDSSVEMLKDVNRAMGSSADFQGKDPNDPWVKQQKQEARDRLMAQFKQAEENPVQTLGQFVGGGLISHGLTKVTGAVVKGTAGLAKSATSAATGASDLAVGAAKDLQAAGEAQIKAQAKYVQDVKDAEADAGTANDTAQKQMLRQYVKNQEVADQRNALSKANYEAQSEADKLNHANKVSQISAQNEAAEQAATEATAQRSAEAQQKYQENVKAAADTESERGELARQEIQTRLALTRRVQKVAADAKKAVDTQFNTVRKGVNSAIDSGDAAQPPITTLVDAVEQAKSMFKGSQEKIPEFDSIIRRADEEGSLESQRRAIMDARNIPGDSYDALKPEHKAIVDEIVADNKRLREAGVVPAEGEEEGTPTISFDHLRGYSSEMGDILRNPDLDGDIRNAVKAVKSHVDALAQNLADKAGVGAKLTDAKKNWYIYKDVFHEHAGPSGSGSPVAKSLKAEDATNATEPFLNKDAEISSRARQMLVGQPFRGPGSYFDPGAGYLVDKLRDIRSRVEALPKNPVEVPPYQEPAPVQPKLKPVPDESSIPVRKPPQEAQPTPIVPKDTVLPKEVTPPAAAAPINIQQVKLRAYQRMADRLKYVDKWQVRALASIAGGAIRHFLGGDILSSVKTAGEVGVASAPLALGRLMDVPEFRDWISQPRARDFKLLGKLQEADKIRVQNGITGVITNLADAGQRVKVAPEIQAFVGPDNVMKIARAISQAKQGAAGGAQRLREAAAQAATGAAVGAGGVVGATGASRVETGTSQGAGGTPTPVPTQTPARSENAQTMVEPSPKGLVKSGNLPIWNRPTVQNADGSHSSEYSTSFQDDSGHEVLVPTIVNGRFLTPDGKKPPEGGQAEKDMFRRAWHHYQATGENLGVFDNAANADAYATKLHNRGAR